MNSPSRPRRQAAASKASNPTAPAKPKGWVLETAPDAPGQSPDQFMAQAAAGGIVGNARTLIDFSAATFGELALTDCARVLKNTAEAVHGGNLTSVEAMLTAQAIALNAIFGELARRSCLNMGEYLDASERYMRLALKAQGQCRATLEALAAIKGQPVIFAQQANINNGGQQQVNNAPVPDAQWRRARSSPASAHAEESVSGPNELLEGALSGGAQLDTRATAAASRTHPSLEPLDAVNRPPHPPR